MKVGIIGATGYGGNELYRLLSKHPHVNECILYTSSEAEKAYRDSYPHLTDISGESLTAINTAGIDSEVDVLFMASPPGAAAELLPEICMEKVKVIDLSGDLRLRDSKTYESWYKRKAADPAITRKAVYGLSELNKEAIRGASVISNPGCFPTAAILGLAPAVSGELIDESSIIIDAKTGVSGAGRKPGAGVHYAETNENFKIYKVNEHQHIPEIEQALLEMNSAVKPLTFQTHLVPMTRGIMTTIYAGAKSGSLKEWHDLYKEFYKDCYFVRVRPVGEFPSTKEVYGSNYCDIGIAFDERTGRITVVSVIDNLMKGAAGQAVQNFNLMNGFDETAGLEMAPLYP
ncbi:N-acetyl-gamma-glutamyl-phosphate reductase [Metabacillus indicus]|uniref:N-acetyl-gamma-glutamyl-phosphate reductase n=1 Tax=Metabacillus indicus TaxID=246786 RepID=UPI00317500D0